MNQNNFDNSYPKFSNGILLLVLYLCTMFVIIVGFIYSKDFVSKNEFNLIVNKVAQLEIDYKKLLQDSQKYDDLLRLPYDQRKEKFYSVPDRK